MFKNRNGAGQKLAEKLKLELSAEEIKKLIILAIPRGGIIVGAQIARDLGVEMDCLIVKKIPSPQSPELAIGAIGEEGVVVWEKELCEKLGVGVKYQQEAVKKKILELEDKKNFFRHGQALLEIKEKMVLIVDDGVATGATAKVSALIAENLSPAEIILAVPVIAKETLSELKQRFSRVIYLDAPEMFFSVDQFYEDFAPVSDDEIKRTLEEEK